MAELCDHCNHPWHGLPCESQRRKVEEANKWETEACPCPTSFEEMMV